MREIKLNSKYFSKAREISAVLGEYAYSPTTEYDVGGSDLGIPCYDAKRNLMYFWFGDTFTETNLIGTHWRSNVCGITGNFDFSKGIKWDRFLCDGDGNAREISHSLKSKDAERREVTRIPTGAICINGVHYLFFMSICEWHTAAGWDVNFCGLMKSCDGENFEQVQSVYFTCCNEQVTETLLNVSSDEYARHFNANFAQVFAIEKDGYVYLFGIPGGRKGSVKLARVRKEHIENQAEYEYLCDNDCFVKGFDGLKQSSDSDANVICGPFVGEVSVCYCKRKNKYFMTYLQANDQDKAHCGIVLRASDDLIHWSDAELLLTYYDYFLLYGGFMHEKLSSADGSKMYMMLSQWVSPRAEDHGYNVKLMELSLNDD